MDLSIRYYIVAITNLHLHGAAVDELAGGGDVVEDDGRLLAAVEHDALALARHPHRAPLAPEHVHRLVVLDLGDGNVLFRVGLDQLF